MAELYHYKCTECDFDIMSTPWGGDVYMFGGGYYLYCCQECKHLSEIKYEITDLARKKLKRKIIRPDLLGKIPPSYLTASAIKEIIEKNNLSRIIRKNPPSNDSCDITIENTKIVSKPLNACSHCGSTKLSRWKPEDGKCPHCGGRIIRLNDIITNTD